MKTCVVKTVIGYLRRPVKPLTTKTSKFCSSKISTCDLLVQWRELFVVLQLFLVCKIFSAVFRLLTLLSKTFLSMHSWILFRKEPSLLFSSVVEKIAFENPIKETKMNKKNPGSSKRSEPRSGVKGLNLIRCMIC